MSSLIEPEYNKWDVRNLPDCTDERYGRVLRLADRIHDRQLFPEVCDDVCKAQSIQEIIQILRTALFVNYILSQRTRIVSAKGVSRFMN